MGDSGVLNRLYQHGQETNPTIRVKFFRHKDKTSKGREYVWNLGHEFKTFEQMRVRLAGEITGPTGALRRVYDTSGNEITDISQLRNGGVYVCTGGEAFTMEGIPTAALPKGAKPAPAKNVEEGFSGELEEMIDADIEKSKTKTCYFFGAKGQASKTAKGAKIIINPSRLRKVDQLIGEVRGKIKLLTGSVQVLYNMDRDGEKLESIDQLEDGAKYICSILKAWSVSMIPDSLEVRA